MKRFYQIICNNAVASAYNDFCGCTSKADLKSKSGLFSLPQFFSEQRNKRTNRRSKCFPHTSRENRVARCKAGGTRLVTCHVIIGVHPIPRPKLALPSQVCSVSLPLKLADDLQSFCEQINFKASCGVTSPGCDASLAWWLLGVLGSSWPWMTV